MPGRPIRPGSPLIISNCRIPSHRISLPWRNGSPRAPRRLMTWPLPLRNTCAAILHIRNTVEAPPAGQDPLDWFLFHSKKGFCNYYATAEVLLLRSAGIPARMVVGFAQGEFDPPNHYVVRQRDSHAWPEVYFPGIGWVEFEPTSNQAPLELPLGENPSPAAPGTHATPVGKNTSGPGDAARGCGTRPSAIWNGRRI